MPFVVDLPIENGGSFHSFLYVYQWVSYKNTASMDLPLPVAYFYSENQQMHEAEVKAISPDPWHHEDPKSYPG